MAEKKWMQKAFSANPGGLHRTTGTPQGKPIPAQKVAKAAAGGYGPLGVKQANLAARGAAARKK